MDDTIGKPITTKTIYLIRHGVASHNVHDPNTGERPNYRDESLTDPSLIRQGVLQASVLGENLKRMGIIIINDNNDSSDQHDNDVKMGEDPMDIIDDDDDDDDKDNKSKAENRPPIELVVSSPLTRCLQTASYIFPTYFQNNFTSSGIMENRGRGNNSQYYVLDKDCKVCCHEDIREAFGMHYPDKRSPLSHIKSKFPTVTYHPSITEHDTDWQPNTRETRHDVSDRTQKFFQWLLHQPHGNIAIVSHGVWMECALTKYCPEVLDYGKKRVYNCEVYCGKLVGTKLVDGGDGSYCGDFDVGLKDMKQIGFYNA